MNFAWNTPRLLKAFALGAFAVVSAPALISLAGFGSAGVAAGSLAAAWQSYIGSVAAGSLFSLLQSAGAAGFSTATFFYLFIVPFLTIIL